MSWFLYLIWTFCFLLSVVVVYFLPITKLLIEKVYVHRPLGDWTGAVFSPYYLKKKKELLESKESLETELSLYVQKVRVKILRLFL